MGADSSPDNSSADTAVGPAGDEDTTVVPDATRTAAAELAWSIDQPVVEPDDPDHHRAPWRRVLVIGAVIVVAAAVVAGGIITWDRYHQPAPAPAPSTAAKPAPTPEKPPAWHLDGTYRVDIRNPEGIIYNSNGTTESIAEFRIPVRTKWVAYRTDCEPAGCTTHSVLLDDVTHQNAANLNDDLARHERASTLRWIGTEWESAGGSGAHGGQEVKLECDNGPVSQTVEVWTTLAPLPDGSFRGTSHRWIMTNECGIGGEHQEVPVTAVRIGDAPPGVFK